MHIIHAFLHFTSLGARKVGSIFPCEDEENQQKHGGPVLSAAAAATTADERSSLLRHAEIQHSLTSEYEDFSHSYAALRLCLYHVVVYYTLAVLGFSYFVEDWTIIQSFYFATVVCTTIGYGDLSPDSRGAKVYTICLALYGIVILGMFLGVIGEYVVDLHNKSIEVRRHQVSSSIVQVLALENTSNADDDRTAAPEDAVQAVTAIAEEELREKTLLEDIYTIIVLEAPIFLVLFLISKCSSDSLLLQ